MVPLRPFCKFVPSDLEQVLHCSAGLPDPSSDMVGRLAANLSEIQAVEVVAAPQS